MKIKSQRGWTSISFMSTQNRIGQISFEKKKKLQQEETYRERNIKKQTLKKIVKGHL